MVWSKIEVDGNQRPSYAVARGILHLWNSVPNRFILPFNADVDYVFVCGCGHSGTTLTAARIGNHSQSFLIGRETGQLMAPAGLFTIRRVLQEWAYFTEANGKKFVVEKTPKHIYSVKNILRILPNAKFIINVRNPHDNIASLFKRFGCLEFAIRRYTEDTSEAIKLSKSVGVLIVKYEDVTSNPKAGFERIFEHIGYPWQDQILSPGAGNYGMTTQRGNMLMRSEEIGEEISPKVGTWNHILSDKQRLEIDKKTGWISSQLGYRGDK